MKNFLNRIFHIEEINGQGTCPTYLYRWTLLRFGSLFSIYLHKFVGDDWSTDLHDHPKRFWSIGLRGGYVETSPHKPQCLFGPLCRKTTDVVIFRAPWIRTFPATHIHRLTGPTRELPCWTLVVVGRIVRPWGFWRGSTWVPWKQYVNSPDARERRSCP